MKTMEIYIRSVWKTNLVYKWNFIIGVLSNIFYVISMMFNWYVVYRNNGKISFTIHFILKQILTSHI